MTTEPNWPTNYFGQTINVGDKMLIPVCSTGITSLRKAEVVSITQQKSFYNNDYITYTVKVKVINPDSPKYTYNKETCKFERTTFNKTYSFNSTLYHLGIPTDDNWEPCRFIAATR